MKHFYTLSLALFMAIVCVNAQGLIVNEISQGPSGAKEFIELLVVGNNSQKTGNLNISDWIIDDNNGDFILTSNTAPGIATGHFRFTDDIITREMPIGSIIVIYNAADQDPAWTFQRQDNNGEDIPYKTTNSAGTATYYIPGTSSLLRAVSNTPSNTSTSYAYTNSTVPPSPVNWVGELGLANNGDAIQTRKPDGTFYQGFGFSTPTKTNVFASFPLAAETGTPAFNAFTGSATGMSTHFTCGSWYFATPYVTVGAAEATPGEPNSTDNQQLIEKVAAGDFDYSILNTDISCQLALPIRLSHFKGYIQDKTVRLTWTMSSEENNDYFIIQRSLDGTQWQEAGRLPSQGNSAKDQNYSFTDPQPLSGDVYYRIVQVDQKGQKEFSRVMSLKLNNTTLEPRIAPNPVSGNTVQLQVNGNEIKRIVIFNMAGKTVYKNDQVNSTQGSLEISVANWAKGIYLIRLDTQSGKKTLKLLRK